MTIEEMLAGGGGLLLVAMTLIQIAPIKVNPWSALARALGKAINKDVLDGLAEVKADQKEAGGSWTTTYGWTIPGTRTPTAPGSCSLTTNYCGTFRTRGRIL